MRPSGDSPAPVARWDLVRSAVIHQQFREDLLRLDPIAHDGG